MLETISIIFFIIFLIAVTLAFLLEGQIIDRLNAVYPKDYKRFLWFEFRLKPLYFLYNVKNGTINDPELLQFYKKYIRYFIIIVTSWICIGISMTFS